MRTNMFSCNNKFYRSCEGKICIYGTVKVLFYIYIYIYLKKKREYYSIVFPRGDRPHIDRDMATIRH